MAITQRSSKNTNRLIITNKRNEDKLVDDVTDIITEVNNLTDGSISTTSLDLSGTLSVDTISEHTSTAGVTVDGVLVKDSSIALADGLVSNLSLKLGADKNNGIYGVSDTQIGIAVEGTLVAGADSSGLFTGNIAEQVGDAGVTVDGLLIKDGGINPSGETATSGVLYTGSIESVTYGAGTITIVVRNSDSVTATGASDYKFSFLLFQL